jgi:hypothetical protein
MPHLAQPAKDGVLPAYCRNTSRESSKSVLILSEMGKQSRSSAISRLKTLPGRSVIGALVVGVAGSSRF